MINPDGITTAKVAATIAMAAVGPFAEVFDELGALMAVMGLLGGVTGHIAVGHPLKTILMPALAGALFGFGFGIAAPALLKAFIGVDILVGGGSVRGFAAAAYGIAVFQKEIFSYVKRIKRGEGGE